MKIRLLSYKISNIRSFKELEIKLSEKNITLIMMPNGTGKTTSIELIKCAFVGELTDKKYIHGFKPNFTSEGEGLFELKISMNEANYTIRIIFNFIENSTQYFYTDTKTGMEVKRPLEFDIFTDEFVEKFIFDGELAKEFLNSNSAYAEQSVKNLYHLEKLEYLNKSIDKVKNTLISESDKTAASKETGLTKFSKELERLEEVEYALKEEEAKLKSDINKYDNHITGIQSKIDTLYSSNQSIQDNIDIHSKEILRLKSERTSKLETISSSMLFVHNISSKMWTQNRELINILVQMKLPKSVSEQFFIDLINHSQVCICGREFEESNREYLRANYPKYLEENNISILNEVKSYALNVDYSSEIDVLLNEIAKDDKDIIREENKLERAKSRINKEQKLLKEQFESEKKKLVEDCERLKARYEVIVATEDYKIKTYKLEDNLKLVKDKIISLREIIEQVERNRMINKNADKLSMIIDKTKFKLLQRIKQNVLISTNDKISKIIQNDDVRVESIDKYIKIRNREGISVGQSLSVSYSFISALFQNSFYDLPFMIDSPAGSLDNVYREEVAKIIPKSFEQLVLFVISSEKPYFTEVISKNYPNSIKYYTIYKENGEVFSNDQQETFENFQDRSEIYV